MPFLGLCSWELVCTSNASGAKGQSPTRNVQTPALGGCCCLRRSDVVISSNSAVLRTFLPCLPETPLFQIAVLLRGLVCEAFCLPCSLKSSVTAFVSDSSSIVVPSVFRNL